MAQAAREAGALTAAHFGKSVKTWSKGAAGPVTEIDLAVDALLKERLGSARPDYGWLSEETADNPERLEKSRVWIVDPIDGTEAFIKGIPQYTISIGLAEAGRPFAGVVYNPITDEMFEGGEGAPAKLNDAPMQASQTNELEGARIIGRPRVFEAHRWDEPWPHLELGWRHSIAYRLALVAAGKFDATILLGFKNEWDIAGGAAIILAAQGTVTESSGAALKLNRADPRSVGLIAAGPALHPLLIERVQHVPHPSEWGPQGWRKAKQGA
ncbi:MAG: inositol monophosphatase [Hyphomonadaceae bacterium]